MLYDIYYADRSLDRCVALNVWGRAERGAVAINTNADGHVWVERDGEWVEGRRTADGKFVAA